MSAGWTAFGQGVQALLETHALAVIAVVLFLEELGIPIPVPGDLMMLLAGIRVAQGDEPLWLVLAVEEAATLAGASLLFFGSRRFGRGLVQRFGWLLHLGPETLARAERQVARHGGWAIVVARLIPGFRIVTVIAAGVLGLPYRTFLPALALGGFLYLLVFTLLGLFVGPTVFGFLERLALPTTALLSLAALAVMALVLHALERANPPGKATARPTLGTTMIAALIAGVAGLLLANGALGVASFFARLLGFVVPTSAALAGDELRLLFGWPVFLGAALLGGALYGLLHWQRLPWHGGVALAAGVPLALTLLLIDPLLDATAGGGTTTGGVALAVIAVLRWIVYGAALAKLLPLIARLRQPVRPDERVGR